MAKRKADDGLEVQRNLVEITPLGAGQEVGRSCIILKYMCAPQALQPACATRSTSKTLASICAQ